MALLPQILPKRNDTTALARRPEDRPVPLRQAIDQLFRDSLLMSSPSLFDSLGSGIGPNGANLYETDDGYIVQVAMPGIKPDSIVCSVDRNVLTCRAESSTQPPGGARALWQGLGGRTEYRLRLPGEVDPDKAEASYEQGVLSVTLSKAASAQARTIKVHTK